MDRAFERLYRRHVGDVYRYALAVLRNAADAEDVTQTTFLNAYRAFQRGERPQSAHNWLIAIAHNVCRQRFRQSARRPQEVAFEDDFADRVDEDPGPTAADIRRALGHLAFNQRAALVMRELEGRSYQEIGEILGISVSAVETLIFRARRALREQIEGSLTCGEAELAISKQLDGRLSRAEKGQLRAHLRECRECSTFARRQRAQRVALKSIGLVPLPGSLTSFFGGGGGATVAGGVAAKVAAVAAAGAVVAGGGYEVANHVVAKPPGRASAAAAAAAGRGEREAARNRVGGEIARNAVRRRAPAAESRDRVGRVAVGRVAGKRPSAAAPKRPSATAETRRAEKALSGHPANPRHPEQAQGPKAGAGSAARGEGHTPTHHVRKHVKKPKRHPPRRDVRRSRPVPPPVEGRGRARTDAPAAAATTPTATTTETASTDTTTTETGLPRPPKK